MMMMRIYEKLTGNNNTTITNNHPPLDTKYAPPLLLGAIASIPTPWPAINLQHLLICPNNYCLYAHCRLLILWLELLPPSSWREHSLQIVCGAWRLGRLRVYIEVIYLSFFTLKLSTWFLFTLKLSVRLFYFFLKFFTLKLSTLAHGNELRNN